MKKLILLTLLFLLSCGQDKTKSSNVKQNVSGIYASQELSIKVYYEEGAEPYTDGISELKLWTVTELNLNALFSGRSTQINVPKNLDQMTKMPLSHKSSWSVEDVLSLAKKHSSPSPNGTTTFHIYFLNGYSSDGSNVIGFHINNTKIMAIFKDVIKSMGPSELPVTRYVEQATIVHELGHALGLVNNGLPMSSAHHDHEHGAHCDKSDCVMYYMNEGKSSMMSYVAQVIAKGSLVMFDQHCLNDAQNFKK